MKQIYLSFLVFWLTCGFAAWGTILGEWRYQDRSRCYFTCRHDQSSAIIFGGLGGPFAFVDAMAHSGFAEHGLQWTCSAEKP
jgi:hypothetical protein